MRSIRQMEPQVDGDEPVGGLSCADETGKNASDCAFLIHYLTVQHSQDTLGCNHSDARARWT